MVAISKIVARNYFKFSGRLSRSEYWGFVGLILVALLVATIVNTIIYGPSQTVSYVSKWSGETRQVTNSTKIETSFSSGYFGWAILGLVAIPLLGATIRRMRDAKASWFSALILIGAVILCQIAFYIGFTAKFEPMDPLSASQFADRIWPTKALFALMALQVFAGLWLLYWLLSPTSKDGESSPLIVV